MRARPRGEGRRRSGKGGRSVRARVLRVPVQRPGVLWPGPRSTGSTTASRLPPAPRATSWSWGAPSGCSAPSGTRRRATAFEGLRSAAQGDDRELVELRLAECDYYLKRPRNARDGLRAVRRPRHRVRAKRCSSMPSRVRELGDHDEYLKTVRRVVERVPRQTLGRRSAEQPRDRLHPAGRRRKRRRRCSASCTEVSEGPLRGARGVEDRLAGVREQELRRDRPHLRERGRRLSAVRLPAAVAVLGGPRARGAERAARSPRSATRSSATDYLNTLLRPARGRAARRPAEPRAETPARRRRTDQGRLGCPGRRVAGPALPTNAPLVRALLGLDLYDQALDELRYAQRVWGDSPAIQATIAWIYRQQGQAESGTRAVQPVPRRRSTR